MTPFPQAPTLCNAVMEKEDDAVVCHALTLQLLEQPSHAGSVLPRQPRLCQLPRERRGERAVECWGWIECWLPKTTAVLEAAAKGGTCISAAHVSDPLAHSC